MVAGLVAVLGVFIFAQTSFKSDDYPNVEPFMQFWSKLRGYVHVKKIDLGKNYQIRLKGDFSNGKISEGDISFSLNPAQPELLELLKDFLVAVDESRLLKVMALETLGETVEGADLQIDFGENEVDFKLTLKTNSENTGAKVMTRFKVLFAATGYVLEDNPEAEFYRNAVIHSEKEKVFVNGKISRANLEKFLSFDK
jgi:hypothetical protein